MMDKQPSPSHSNSLEEGRGGSSSLESGGGHLSAAAAQRQHGVYPGPGSGSRAGSNGSGSSGVGAASPSQGGAMLVVPQPLKGPQGPANGTSAQHHAVTSTVRKYQCKMCPQVFAHKSGMQQHSREAHRGELKPHQCGQCLRSFSSTHQLAQHVRIHTGEKPYKCSCCDRRFKQLSHVQQHTRLHTGERPYKCHLPECGRAFIQLSNLQQHLRSHDGQMERAGSRPFHCNICGKGFALDSSLRTHRSGQHAALIGGAASQSCPICHKICVNAGALMEHMSANHKDPSAPATPSKRKQHRERKVLPVLQPQQQRQGPSAHHIAVATPISMANHVSVAAPISAANHVTVAAPLSVAPGVSAFPTRSLVVANIAAMGLAAAPLLGNGL